MQVADVETVRAVRRELSRHAIDVSEAVVSAMHGVVHLTGRVKPLRGHEAEFEEEVNNLPKILRQRAGIRDVIMEWSYEGVYTRLGDKLGSTSKTRSRA